MTSKQFDGILSKFELCRAGRLAKAIAAIHRSALLDGCPAKRNDLFIQINHYVIGRYRSTFAPIF